MPTIIETPAVETARPYLADVESLIAAGEGKSLTYDAADGIVDEKTAESLKLKFQRTANSLDRTARAKVNKSDDGSFSVVFTLKPKQKTRTVKPSDESAAPTAEPTADAAPDETPAAAPKPRGK